MKPFKHLLVLGDSLSYNRYDYGDECLMSATDCEVGMLSWSFLLRDRIITGAKDFIHASTLRRPHTSLPGTLFGNRSFDGNNDTVFNYPAKTDSITLCLQKCPDGGTYTVKVDGAEEGTAISFAGDEKQFHGREVFWVTMPADAQREYHEITFTGEGPYTVIGLSSEERTWEVSGYGSMTVDFFVRNYEEKVRPFSFDAVLMILGANDYQHTPLADFESAYRTLLERIRVQCPGTQIVLMSPTDLQNATDPESDANSYTSLKTAEPYRDVMRKLASEFDGEWFDTLEAFKGYPIGKWRFDNVHMTRLGNVLLYRKLEKFMNI